MGDTGIRTYWAADQDLSRFVAEVDERCEDYYSVLRSARLIELFRSSHWAAFAGARTGGNLGVAGEASELTTIEMNEYGNLYQHVLNLITAQRPEFESQATNSDHKSQSQTIVANAVVEYAHRQRDMESYLQRAAGFMLLYAEGWIGPTWNATIGADFRPDENGRILKAGDIEYHVFGPTDVARDSYAESATESAWYIPRQWANRYDLIARYPELTDEIASLPSKYDVEEQRPRLVSRQWTQTTGVARTDEVPVYTFLHRKCDAIPDGRMTIYLSPEIVLSDGPLPYRDIPLYRMSAMDIDGTTTGYTMLWDVLAPQQAYNAVATTITSNQAALGVQNVWVPAGSNLSWKALRAGLNLIEGGVNPPQPLNLLSTKPETFQLLQVLQAAMERYTGMNATVRGTPADNLKSGAALALVYSQAIQFIALTQKAYLKCAEKVATATLHAYQDFGQAKRAMAIAGESSRPYSIEFSSQDISDIDRVSVKIANPLTGTIAGRYNIAEMMLANGMLTDPKQLIGVLTTGRLDPVTEAPIRERMNIKNENEKLSRGEPVRALFLDNHLLHIQEHATTLASPEAREAAAPEGSPIGMAVRAHVQEHIDLWRTTDPDILAALGIPPPPSMMMPPMPGPNGAPGDAPSGKGTGPAPAPMPGMAGNPAMGLEGPSMPRMPFNPVTKERVALAAGPMPPAVS